MGRGVRRFSKLILMVEDRKLVDPETTTKSGDDLYEYSGGELRQVNVGIGSVWRDDRHGYDSGGTYEEATAVSSMMTVVMPSPRMGHVFSSKRSRAATANRHRISTCVWTATETVPIRRIPFVAANREGSEALLEKSER